ncbi:hypothetical protein [Hymenobacter negativus]|uniref:Uncharacterized protein n=1 Tax=Hymenobacter negativus TaxID=2795026 RepID=A0ABS0Q4R7_9BACT|nr:hypothetical protein [Hymenobacter negativus]MBH8557567.1 hypothetical protein [Hymenobacter negativus]
MPEFANDPEGDAEWEGLLQQLRHQPLAQPRPFFYGRVQARLAAETSRAWLPGWMRRPAYAMLVGALVLVLSGDDKALASGTIPPAASAPIRR